MNLENLQYQQKDLCEKYGISLANDIWTDYGALKMLSRDHHTYLWVTCDFSDNIEDELQQLVQHQFKINQRLRNLGLQGILVDIIEYEIIFQEQYIICRCMELVIGQEFQSKLGIGNCLKLFIGLELKGVRDILIMGVKSIKVNKIVPFTNLTQIIDESNQRVIIFGNSLVEQKQISQLNDILKLKYLELNYGFSISDIVKLSKINLKDGVCQFLNQSDEVIATSKNENPFEGEIEIKVKIGVGEYLLKAEWNQDQELVHQNSQLNELSRDLFIPVNKDILAQYNKFTFIHQHGLIYLNYALLGDVRNKIIHIPTTIARQHWFLAFSSIMKMFEMHILCVTYSDKKLYLRTLCKLNQTIPLSQLEIDADIREEDFNLILDQCNTNQYVELLDVSGSNFKDSLLQGLTQGGFLRGIKEFKFKGCPFITDEGISLLGNFGVQRLDLSYTTVEMVLPQGLKHLNLAHSKFKEWALIDHFHGKDLINLESLDISGIGTDNILQAIFTGHYKDLRQLVADNCKLSLLIFKLVNEARHVRNFDVLSLSGSIVEVQESIFKKNNYHLLGGSKSKILKLDFSNNLISDRLVQSLVEGGRVLSNLKVLCLRGCKLITDKSIEMLCEAPKELTQNLKSLDISDLPLLTDYSLDALVYKGLNNLVDLNIANLAQIRVGELKKAFESGKFNSIKCLGISGINEWGGQAEVFQLGIPELCYFFIKNYLSELSVIEIYIQNKTFKNIQLVISNLIFCQILIKVISNDEIILDEESIQSLIQIQGCERLLINNKPIIQLDNIQQEESDVVNLNQFYENLFYRKSDLQLFKQEIHYLNLIHNFKNIQKINVQCTEIKDNDILGIVNNLQLKELKLKNCKSLTFNTLLYLKKISNTLINLDYRGTVFENRFATLKELANFNQLIKLNQGHIYLELNQSSHLGKDLVHLPNLWMQLDYIKSLNFQITATQFQNFEFMFKTITVLLNKNQDYFKKLRVRISKYKMILEKSIQLFNNSLMNLNNLITLDFGYENMKNINFFMIKNLILSISQLENLRELKLTLNGCRISQINPEILEEYSVFEPLRDMPLRSFTLNANDTITYNPNCFTYLFKNLAYIETLKVVNLNFARHPQRPQSLGQLFDGLQQLQLSELRLNFDQCTNNYYSRELWAKILDILRNESCLNELQMNFNHDFQLNDIDIHNTIESIYSIKMQFCQISLIGCYKNEKIMKNLVKEEMKNYYFYI